MPVLFFRCTDAVDGTEQISDFEYLGKAYLAACKELEAMYVKEEPKAKEWTQSDELNNEATL